VKGRFPFRIAGIEGAEILIWPFTRRLASVGGCERVGWMTGTPGLEAIRRLCGRVSGGLPATGVIVGPGLEPGVWTGPPPVVVEATVTGVVAFVGPLAAVVVATEEEPSWIVATELLTVWLPPAEELVEVEPAPPED
jgi:hypothetical protein